MDLEQIPVQIIRSPKRKTSAIKILESAVEVRVPSWVDNRYVERLLHERREWIEKHYTAVKDNQSRFELLVIKGHRWPLQGDDYKLDWALGIKPQVNLSADQLQVVITKRSKLPYEEQVSRQLKQWYRDRAESYLKDRLEYWSGVMGLAYRSVHIKSYRRRWGSCSITRDISLNWRLIMLPVSLIDYVLIHELAHICHFNHGRAFWALVSCYCKEWKGIRKRLNDRSVLLKW